MTKTGQYCWMNVPTASDENVIIFFSLKFFDRLIIQYQNTIWQAKKRQNKKKIFAFFVVF